MAMPHLKSLTTTADTRAAANFYSAAKPYGNEFFYMLGQNFRLGVRTSGSYKYLRTGYMQNGEFVPNTHILGAALGSDIADEGIKLEKNSLNMLALLSRLRKMTGYADQPRFALVAK